MTQSFKEYVIHELEQMPFYKASANGISHTIKCPYCNDDSPSHGHFCLKIDVDNEEEPILFNCLKCPAGGVVNRDVLNDIGINVSKEMNLSMMKVNRRYAKKNKLIDVMIEDFEIPPVIDTALADIKLAYINDRIGTDFGYEAQSEYRIITKFSDFIFHNEIGQINGVSPGMIKFIDDNYVGFLSLNRNNIVFRKIYDECTGNRYIKVKIHEKNLDPNSYYMIPAELDLMYTGPMNIHIAEGTFDILSIYNNLPKDKYEGHNLYFAVCGFGYATVVKNVLKLGITTGINLHIYADNDKSDYQIKQAIYKVPGLSSWVKSLYIHRNSDSDNKDFGVQPKFIKESVKKIKM